MDINFFYKENLGMKKILLAALLITVSSMLFSAKKGGVTMPNKLKIKGTSLVLNGLGIREATIFNVDVYVAGLYLEKKSKNASSIMNSNGLKYIKIQFVRAVDKDDITEAWTKAFKKVVGRRFNNYKSRVVQLNGYMTKTKVGTITAYAFSDDGVDVWVGGRKKGTIKGKEFAKAMLSIWLGSSPPNHGLKTGMLGK